jgi:hypothetical protein
VLGGGKACEHTFVGNAGSPGGHFHRALATGNPLIATLAALEAGRLGLADALALTLRYRDHDPARFEKAAVRWHARFCLEARGVAGEDAQLAWAALLALRGPRPESGARALMGLFDGLVMIQEARVMEDWLGRRPAS